MMTILDLIQQETHHTYRQAGKEYNGPCPWCGDDGKGDKADRFIIWPGKERYWCRRCDRKGDAIQFAREYKHLPYRQAREYVGLNNSIIDIVDTIDTIDTIDTVDSYQPLSPPTEQWLEQAWPFLIACQERLWSDGGAKALAWLRSRGLTDATISAAGLGYCDYDHYVTREDWGLGPETTKDGKPKGLWLPRGVLIPWIVDKELWAIRIRRPTKPEDALRYYFIPGGQASGLYNADKIKPGHPAMIVEGELDALTIGQANYTAAATGSTQGSRRTRWIARLSTASTVLVAYDNDEAGDNAAAYWLEALPHAKRWRPYWGDANQLQQDRVSVAAWIAAGLGVQPTTIGDRPPLPIEKWVRGIVTIAEARRIQLALKPQYVTALGLGDDGYYVACPDSGLCKVVAPMDLVMMENV